MLTTCIFKYVKNGTTFIFNSNLMIYCTTYIGKSKKTGKPKYGSPWCSTRTTRKNRHIPHKGYYGDCPEDPQCSLAFNADSEQKVPSSVRKTTIPLQPSTICSTVSGAKPNLPCVFPFTFNGIIYDR